MIELGKAEQIGEVRIGEAAIPIRLTMTSLAWLQKHNYITSPGLGDLRKFADAEVQGDGGAVSFLASVLAAIASAAKIDLSREAIAEALGASEPLVVMQVNMLMQRAIYRAYAGPFPEGKASAVPGAAPAGSAGDGIGAKRSSRRRNAG